MRMRWRRCADDRCGVVQSGRVPGDGRTVSREVGACFFFIGLENCAAAALVFAGLDLQSDAGGFGEGFIDTSVLHGGAF